MMQVWGLAVGVLAFATSTAAQESANSTTAAGSVTGHVTCSDTLRPARFAEVRAVPVPEAGQVAAQLAAEQAGHDLRKSGQTLSVVSSTSVDGSFVLKGLPPGDYLILATLPGYLLPAAYAHPTKTEDLQALISQIPSVHVTSGETTDVTLSMKRGGVIAGHVRFDDRAPAVRVQVAVESKTITNDRESKAWLGGVNVLPSQRDTTTDDEGAFRIAGLPPGQYIVKAELHFGETRRETVTENGSSSVDSGNEGVTQLEVYAPESMHRSSAATLELKSDEQIADVRVLVPLDKLYSVSGRVLTKEDREPLVAGQALLLDETDESFYRRGAIRPDGTWIIGFVPSGTYKVRFLGVRKMPDPGESEEEIRGRSYEASFPVVVSDGNLSMDDLLLNPAALTHPQ